MKIAVNTRLLLKDKLEGIGWFTYETLKRITFANPGHEFYFIFDRQFSEEFIFSSNITPVIASPPTRHPFIWYYWLKYILPGVLKKIKPDIFLSPDGFLPFSLNSRSLIVIHDLSFVHRPFDLPYFTQRFYNKYFPLFAEKCDRIATVSQYSKRDISKLFSISKDKIDVVYDGANEFYRPVNYQQKREIKQKYTSGDDYFVFIGALHPRKNVVNLLLAFERFKKQINRGFKLVIVGARMFKTRELYKTYKKMQSKEDIIFTGRLNPAELRLVLGSALALVFVPFFEGFGIPALEAMYCDVPVITSNTSSLPEVCGPAALYSDPLSVSSITNNMIKIVKDKKLREILIEKARIQRTKYSWNKSSNLLWESIMKTLNILN